ncbi:uncharacterized protein [Paramisgurnus dabryanus]|uniref:uncharacterized protein n=1 Tax=Paramisgurnus dabryanus TaxID=90735 RepID=UPI0031F44D80
MTTRLSTTIQDRHVHSRLTNGRGAAVPPAFLIMCTASSHAGCKSHLYNAIRSYLQSENRAQPIIGLNRITEMWTNNEPPVYFCDVCFLRILKTDIRNHIVGSLHRYNYIKSHHAHGWRSYTDLTLLARPLMDLAKTVEQREGTGDVQVLCVDDSEYKEMTSWPVPAAFGKLQRIRNQQDPNVIQSVVHNSEVKGNEAAVQEFENNDKNYSESKASPKHPSTPPVSSKCSGIIEPLHKQSNANRTSPSPKTLSPVRPLLQSQEASTHLNQMDCNVLSRMTSIESSLAPSLVQHINQDQTVIQDKYQIPQRWMMSSKTQCLAETRSLHMSRTISLVRPPSQWSPIRIPYQNETVHPNEEESQVSHPFPLSYGSHSLHLVQTANAYEAQLQTSSLTVSHMVPERTQDGTNKQESFSDESCIHTTEPVSAVDLRVIEPIITQRALEPHGYNSHGYNSIYDEIDFKEPFSTDFEAHAVEAQSHTSVKEKIPLPSQSPSSQIQSIEDTPKSCTKKNPLIGLQAVIKCQSVDGNPPPCCYLCQLCSMKLKKKNVISHLTGLQHRQSYIEVFHPQLLSNIKQECHNENERLDDIAMQLEQQDGRGQIKVMRLSACLISEVMHRDYHWCMKILNCGASVEPFNKLPDKTTAHSQVLKRPAESIKSFSGASLPNHLIPQKMKKVDPTNVISTKSVKNPVFKVSLSLQEGPVVIERDPLRVTATVAPEIENQSPKCTYTENKALSLEINRQSEDQTCLHACPPTVYNQEESWKTLAFPDGNALTQASIPTLTHPHTQVSHVDSRFIEVVSPVRYAYEGQYDHSQAIQVVEPSLRIVECDSLEEMPTYADCPVQDGFFCGNDWILQRQVTGPSAQSHPEYMSNMWY